MAALYNNRPLLSPPDDGTHGIDSVRQLRYRTGKAEPVHAHEQGQLIFPLRGVAKIRTAQHMWVLTPGRALWLPGSLPHGMEAMDDLITQNIYLQPEASHRYSTVCRGLQVTPLLTALAEAGPEAIEEKSAARIGMIRALLHNELTRLAEIPLCQITLPQDRRLRQVCDTLCARLNHDTTLSELGQQVGASERTLARLFREETQLSFSEWRQQIRLMEAVCNLARGAAVNRLAGDLGYASPSAFIAMFRKKLGVSPQRYMQGAR